MGQKINSNIFRLGIKKTEWKSKYFENTKEEFSLYSYQFLEIKQFLRKFLTNNGSIFNDFKLQYSGNIIYFFFFFLKLNFFRVGENSPSLKPTISFVTPIFEKLFPL